MLADGRRLSTWWTYSTHLRRLAAAFPAGPASAQPMDLERWLTDCYADRADDTRKNAATAARTFYAWAYEAGLVDSDPAARLAGRKVRPHDGFPKRWRPLIGRYVEAAEVGQRTLRIRLGYLRRFAIDHPDPWEPRRRWPGGWLGIPASLPGTAHGRRCGRSTATPTLLACPTLIRPAPPSRGYSTATRCTSCRRGVAHQGRRRRPPLEHPGTPTSERLPGYTATRQPTDSPEALVAADLSALSPDQCQVAAPPGNFKLSGTCERSARRSSSHLGVGGHPRTRTGRTSPAVVRFPPHSENPTLGGPVSSSEGLAEVAGPALTPREKWL